MSSADALSSGQQQLLLQMARESILHGFASHHPLKVDPADYDQELQEERACFVTLHINGRLRGCIGTLTPTGSLVEAVCENAYSAAFRDLRFLPLRRDECEQLDIEISVLTPSEQVHFDNEEDLLSQLRPGVDGLILEDGMQRGTFLPSVWESLPEPQDFFQQLKRKAGLPVTYWSPTIKISRYETYAFSDTSSAKV